jgi:Flp pilus assembly pilin Flp
MEILAEPGQTTTEYALVLALITVAVVLAIAGLSGMIGGLFTAATAAFA